MLTNQRDSQNAREMPQNFYMMESGLCRNSISKLSHRAKTFWKEENHAQLHRETGGEEPEIYRNIKTMNNLSDTAWS